MIEITGETDVTIQTSAQAVYDYLLDFTRHSEWAKNIGKVWQLTPGPIGVGTKFRAMEWSPPSPLGRTVKATLYFMRGLLTGASSFSEAEITALEPGRSIAWIGRVRKGKGEFNRSAWEIELQPQGNSTHLIQRFHYMPQTEAARKMLAALGDAPGIRAACAVNLAQLKKKLEQRVTRNALQTI